jgi:hypothetical protein
MKKYSKGTRIIFFILMGALAILVFGSITMLLWNNVLAAVVNVHTITFLQALGILVLSKILFGGFRGGSGNWGHRRRQWKENMMAKWSTMSPDEREKFKSEWQKRCGKWGYKGWDANTETTTGNNTSE